MEKLRRDNFKPYKLSMIPELSEKITVTVDGVPLANSDFKVDALSRELIINKMPPPDAMIAVQYLTTSN